MLLHYTIADVRGIAEVDVTSRKIETRIGARRGTRVRTSRGTLIGIGHLVMEKVEMMQIGSLAM